MQTSVQEPSDDKAFLKNERIRFGLGTILYQSEEAGLGGIPTVIIRALGGDDRHIGLLGTFSSFGFLASVLANNFLRWKNSNRGAMVFSMLIGFVISSLTCLSLLLSYGETFRPFALYVFVALSVLLGGVNGLQANIECNWIGDLVHEKVRGWFTKIKWILSICGILVFTNVLGKFTDMFPVYGGYAAVYALFAVSFFAAAFFIYPRIPDRVPKTANFFSAGTASNERLNYKDKIYWLYQTHGVLWMSGRQIFNAFTAAYLIEQYHFTMAKLAYLLSIQSIMSIAVLYVIGDRTDKWGSRKPFIFVLIGSASIMSLWIMSAKWGIVCIFIAYFLGGLAGHTLSMLGNNFALEVLPAKGRSAYMALARLIIAPVSIFAVASAGWLLHRFVDFHVTFSGFVLSRYHLLFFVSMLICFVGIIPLLIIGKRKVGVLNV